jgi:hypothetical protein
MKRKHAWSLLSLLVWAYTTSAQTELPPKQEYRLSASTTTISLARGQQDSVKLYVTRSKSFKTGKASIAINAPVAPGLSLSIKELPERPDEYMVYLFASAKAEPGQYSFVPTCTLKNKNKGIVLQLMIH